MRFSIFALALLAWSVGTARADDDSVVGCQVLRPGETQEVVGNVGTPLRAKYLLLREPDRPIPKDYPVSAHESIPKGTRVKAFVAVVNYDFRNSQGEADAGLAKKYEDQTARCFWQAAPKLRGPDGEFLELRLSRDVLGIPPVPAKVVLIGDIDRANSVHWRSTMSCATIVHETLHVLGLVDEYAETARYLQVGTARIPMYNCRSLGPSDSIMSSHETAYRAAMSARPSYLSPAHFFVVAYPGCEHRNEVYYDCAKYAYTTARDGKEFGACRRAIPKECRSPGWVNLYR